MSESKPTRLTIIGKGTKKGYVLCRCEWPWTVNFPDRRSTEDVAAHAFDGLPEERRRQLLRGAL
jgi:hypothetical protein